MTGPHTVTQSLARARILPVIVMDDAAAAPALGRALAAGGLRLVEVTFRTPGACAVLRAMAEDPELLVGAGTVVSVDQVDQAVAAGARFVVSPGFDVSVVRRCQELCVPTFPGVATATELQAALAAGVEIVKFFPAELLGGPAMIRALAAPFPTVRFIPTGGIGEAQLAGYLANPAVLAVGGSWMVPAAAIARPDWTQITVRTAQAVAAARRA